MPINSICRKYLERQIRQKAAIANKRPKEKNDFLFTTKFNTPLNSQLYSCAIKTIIEMINVSKSVDEEMEIFSGHTFRHTFATRCFEAGIQPKVVQSYLGHATLQMTMDLYTHVMPQKASMDIERIVPEHDNVVDITRIVV